MTTKYWPWAAAYVAAGCLMGQTRVDIKTQGKSADLSSFSTTKPAQTGTTLPGTCSTGQVYVLQAGSGANLQLCTSNNVWTPLGGSAGAIPTMLKLDGAVAGSSNSFDLLSSAGSTISITPNGNDLDIAVAPDNSVFLNRNDAQGGADTYCVPASGSGLAYTCALPHPLTTYTEGMRLLFTPDANCTGGATTTLDVNANGARRIFQNDGRSDPTAAQCGTGSQLWLAYSGALNGNAGGWRILSGGAGGGGTSGPVIHAIAYPFNGGGSVLSVGTTVYLPDVPFACSISGWALAVDQGTATVDVWVGADSTSLPTAANSVTGAARPSIATGNRIRSTALSSWSTLIPAHSSLAFALTAVSGATQATISVECDQ